MGAVYRASDVRDDGRVARQAPARRPSRRAFRGRVAAAGRAEPPTRGQGARLLQRRRRSVPGHAAGGGDRPRRAAQGARLAGTADRRGRRLHPPGLRGPAVRPRAADRPSRRQAAEPDRRRSRRGARRLRHRAHARRRHARARPPGIGTPRYMSPEVFAGGAVSPRSDVFSIAATLWTLLTGEPPVYASPTKLAELRPDVPHEIEEAVVAGLEMIPERRVASVDAFARAIGGGGLQHTEGRSLVSSVERPGGPAQAARGDRAHRCRRVRGGRRLDRPHRRHHRRARVPVGLGRRLGRDRRRAPAPRAGTRRRGAAERPAAGRRRLPQRPALRGANRRRNRLRAVHDARRAADAGRTRDRHAVAARPPRRRPLRPGRCRARGDVRRADRSGDRDRRRRAAPSRCRRRHADPPAQPPDAAPAPGSTVWR